MTGAAEGLVLILTRHQVAARHQISGATRLHRLGPQHDAVLRGRGIELDVELDAPARRHHDRVSRLFAPSVAPFCRRTVRHRGPQPRSECSEPMPDAVDVSKMQADVRVRCGIDETPKLFALGQQG